MKTGARIDGSNLKIYLESENQEESSLIFDACRSAKIEAFGAVSVAYTWAWFFVPLKKDHSVRIASDKAKK